jgi:hypothetical protein
LLDEEAEAIPAESVRLKRKSTSTKYKKGTALSHISRLFGQPFSYLVLH